MMNGLNLLLISTSLSLSCPVGVLLNYGLGQSKMDWTSIENYGLHQMVLPVEVHILEFVPMAILNYGPGLKTMDSES